MVSIELGLFSIEVSRLISLSCKQLVVTVWTLIIRHALLRVKSKDKLSLTTAFRSIHSQVPTSNEMVIKPSSLGS